VAVKKDRDATLEWYEANAERYAAKSLAADMSQLCDRFAAYLPQGGRILDAGCGSGRDARYFLKKGFRVDAFDLSENMCRIASCVTGLDVRCMDLMDLEARDMYDGIWASASLLHLKEDEIAGFALRAQRALRDHGVFAFSMKTGDCGEKDALGRSFTFWSEGLLQQILSGAAEFELIEQSVSKDRLAQRQGFGWVNVFLRKVRP